MAANEEGIVGCGRYCLGFAEKGSQACGTDILVATILLKGVAIAFALAVFHFYEMGVMGIARYKEQQTGVAQTALCHNACLHIGNVLQEVFVEAA